MILRSRTWHKTRGRPGARSRRPGRLQSEASRPPLSERRCRSTSTQSARAILHSERTASSMSDTRWRATCGRRGKACQPAGQWAALPPRATRSSLSAAPTRPLGARSRSTMRQPTPGRRVCAARHGIAPTARALRAVVAVVSAPDFCLCAAKPMPTARDRVAATVSGNFMYVAGGSPVLPTGSVFEMYSIQTDSWKTGPLARAPPRRLCRAQCAA